MILGAIFIYPIMIIDNQTRNIEETMHYFITYAGALSTVNLERKELFVDLSNKSRYREIASIFKKLVYLVESIKVDFSTASYKLAHNLKAEHFARFLERMGIALSFNSNPGKFFIDEQKVLINAYAIVYEEGLERIKMVQEMFTSLILAFAFVLATILLVPFISGTNANVYLKFGIFGILLLDLMMILFAKFFIPKDPLYHDLGYEDSRKRVAILTMVCALLSFMIAPFIFITSLPIMLKFALSITPLYISGFYSNREEREVWLRDTLFPAFIRSLGDVHQAKGGTLTTTVETLLPHNFGILNPMVEKVFKRLKITADKFNSWFLFAKESGSSLISEFMDIFISVVYRGGSSQIAGQIVSDNMSRLNGLRDQKKEFASTFKASVYGSFFGLALTIYLSLLISILLIQIFTSLTGGLEGGALDLVGDIFPTQDGTTDEGQASFLIAIILVIHSVIGAYVIKDIDGGNKLSMFSDVVLLIWFGAIIEISVTWMFKGIFASYLG